jgi:hypothetical protein
MLFWQEISVANLSFTKKAHELHFAKNAPDCDTKYIHNYFNILKT